MINLKSIVSVVALSVSLLFGAFGCNKAKESKYADEFLGDRATQILTAPDRTEVFRVKIDYDPARPSLLALAKQAFPDDKEIQELK